MFVYNVVYILFVIIINGLKNSNSTLNDGLLIITSYSLYFLFNIYIGIYLYILVMPL